MRGLTLKRISESKEGTFGVLYDGSVPFVVTLERRWLGNQRMISCIPTGYYICKQRLAKDTTVSIGNNELTYEVIMEADARDNILFHVGNYDYNSQGCILVADKFGGVLNAPPVQARSKKAPVLERSATCVTGSLHHVTFASQAC